MRLVPNPPESSAVRRVREVHAISLAHGKAQGLRTHLLANTSGGRLVSRKSLGILLSLERGRQLADFLFLFMQRQGEQLRCRVCTLELRHQPRNLLIVGA